MKKLFYLLLFLALGIRIYESFSLPKLEVGGIYSLKMEVYHARARSIDTIEPLYTQVSSLENGTYHIRFKLLSKKKFYSEVEVLEVKRGENSSFQKYLSSLLERMTKGRDPSFVHFLEAILAGKSWALFREEKQMFQYLGLSHLLAMSGLHISLFFLFCEKILMYFHVEKRKRNYLKILISTLYALAVFASPSFIRAYIMGLFYLLAELLEEKMALCQMVLVKKTQNNKITMEGEIV